MNTLIIFMSVLAATCALPIEPQVDAQPSKDVQSSPEEPLLEEPQYLPNEFEEPAQPAVEPLGVSEEPQLDLTENVSNEASKDSEENSKQDSNEQSYDFLAIFAVFKDPKSHRPVVLAEEIPLNLSDADFPENSGELFSDAESTPGLSPSLRDLLSGAEPIPVLKQSLRELLSKSGPVPLVRPEPNAQAVL